MVLTRDNYYSREADIEFMSCSQYQGWLECEAKQMAKLRGWWADDTSEAFLVGNYFHTAFEGKEAHEQFKIEHAAEIYLKQTKAEAAAGIFRLRAPYVQANKMISVAKSDPLIRSLVEKPGDNEAIMTGVLFGIPWRTRVDKYVNDARIIIDYKTCASITELYWNSNLKAYETFIEKYGYMRRAAVYSEIEKQVVGSITDPKFILIAISKQDYPDKEVLYLNHRQRYDYELEVIRDRLPYILRVKNGLVKPTRCGTCDYCRATKQLFEIKPYYKLIPEFRGPREEDYAEGPVLVDAQPPPDMDSMS